MGQPSLPHVTSRNQTAPSARPANSARRSTFQPATTEAGTFAGLWIAQTDWRRRARPLTSVARAPRSGLRRRPGKRPPAGRCGPLGAGPARRSSSGPHFACGAGAPPEVPGGGTTFGSPVLGAGFSMVGSTSFGWMTPFDRFSFWLRFSPGAELSGAAGVGSGLPGAWANTEPATMVTPATTGKVVSRHLSCIP
jgi:hypothetical protein